MLKGNVLTNSCVCNSSLLCTYITLPLVFSRALHLHLILLVDKRFGKCPLQYKVQRWQSIHFKNVFFCNTNKSVRIILWLFYSTISLRPTRSKAIRSTQYRATPSDPLQTSLELDSRLPLSLQSFLLIWLLNENAKEMIKLCQFWRIPTSGCKMGLQKTYFSYFLWPHIAILYHQKECNKQKSGSRSLKYYLLLLGAIISGGAIAVGAILIFTLMLRLLAA